MNVQEILLDSDLLAPNSFPVALKIRWMNQIQRQLQAEMPASFAGPPPDIREDQLSLVPRFPNEYHELFSLGVAKRIAERTNDYKTANELESRYQSLLQTAKERAKPTIKKVKISRKWM